LQTRVGRCEATIQVFRSNTVAAQRMMRHQHYATTEICVEEVQRLLEGLGCGDAYLVFLLLRRCRKERRDAESSLFASGARVPSHVDRLRRVVFYLLLSSREITGTTAALAARLPER
jgi:hypothetical protein